MADPFDAFPDAKPQQADPFASFPDAAQPASGRNAAQVMPKLPPQGSMRSYPVNRLPAQAEQLPPQEQRSWLGQQYDNVNKFAEGSLLQYDNLRLAGPQRTNPNVYHGDGNYLRPKIGEAVPDVSGGMYVQGPDGKLTPTDGKTQVILKDPASGKLTVFQRMPEWDEGGVAAIGRLVGEGMLTNPVTGASRTVSLGSQTAANTAAARAAEVGLDMAAADRLGVRQFGPAYSSPPVRAVAKQVSELPILGDTTRNALDEAITGTRDAATRIAGEMGRATTMDEAGRTLQTGLDRYRSANLARLEPGVVEGLGIPSVAAVPRQTMMSQEAATAAQQAAPIRQQIGADVTQTTRGVTVPAARPMSQILTTRTTTTMLDDAQLDRLVRTPSAATSFGARSEALYERAWRMLPPMMRENNTANPMLLSPVNTRQALGQIDDAIANQIAGQGTLGSALAERLRNPRAEITLSDMRAIRTEVGRALGNTNPLQQTLNRSQLNGLYGAISRDMEVGLETIANRAAIATQRGGNRAGQLTPDQARQAAGALRAFRTADRYFRQGMSRMDNFTSVLQANTPEQAAQRFVTAGMEGGRGNIALMQTAHAALRPDEWGDVASMTLRAMGAPLPSARGITQEVGFSVSSFMTRWERMDPRAQNLLFGNPEHAQSINDLVRTVRRLSNVEAMANTSRSASNAMGIGGIMAAGGAIASGADAGMTLIGTAMAGAGASLLLSRPSYARWTAQYARLRAAALRQPQRINTNLVTHINQLKNLVDANPDLEPIYQSIRAENNLTNQKNKPQPEQRPASQIGGASTGQTSDNPLMQGY